MRLPEPAQGWPWRALRETGEQELVVESCARDWLWRVHYSRRSAALLGRLYRLAALLFSRLRLEMGDCDEIGWLVVVAAIAAAAQTRNGGRDLDSRLR